MVLDPSPPPLCRNLLSRIYVQSCDTKHLYKWASRVRHASSCLITCRITTHHMPHHDASIPVDKTHSFAPVTSPHPLPPSLLSPLLKPPTPFSFDTSQLSRPSLAGWVGRPQFPQFCTPRVSRQRCGVPFCEEWEWVSKLQIYKDLIGQLARSTMLVLDSFICVT